MNGWFIGVDVDVEVDRDGDGDGWSHGGGIFEAQKEFFNLDTLEKMILRLTEASNNWAPLNDPRQLGFEIQPK